MKLREPQETKIEAAAKATPKCSALPVRGRMPRNVERRKPLNMKEPGNHAFGVPSDSWA
jgi:hypothetical protein